MSDGTAVGYAIVGTLGAAMVSAMTGTLDDVIMWALGPAAVSAILTALAWMAVLAVIIVIVASAGRRSRRVRVHFRPDTGDAYMAGTVEHEANGHASVAYGVGATGIRARVNRNGSGWCEARSRSLVGRLAFVYGGEAAAGPEGCDFDRRLFARDLRRAPARQRTGLTRQAHALAHRHKRNAFGARVARSLKRSGRFR
ncbi:MAG TPA: hypothetical protein VIU11_14340 [Nakamurella sp.]